MVQGRLLRTNLFVLCKNAFIRVVSMPSCFNQSSVCYVKRVIIYRATWATFKPKLEKMKEVHSEKITYISGNGTS